MTIKEIQKALKWDVPTAKIALRNGRADVSELITALVFEMGRPKPRKRLVTWICHRIPTLPLPAQRRINTP